MQFIGYAVSVTRYVKVGNGEAVTFTEQFITLIECIVIDCHGCPTGFAFTNRVVNLVHFIMSGYW